VTATTERSEAAGQVGRLLLDAQQVTMQFGGLKAVDKVDLQVHAGEIVGLIGPNGAGKSTVFNLITGALAADDGTIFFLGHDITHAGPARRPSSTA
jgi:ABC-type branched-subunit amino acid transport system ATPase component